MTDQEPDWKALAQEYERDCHRLSHAKLDLERALELEIAAHKALQEKQPLLDQLLLDRERLRCERDKWAKEAQDLTKELSKKGWQIKELRGQLARATGEIQ